MVDAAVCQINPNQLLSVNALKFRSPFHSGGSLDLWVLMVSDVERATANWEDL